MATLKVKNVGPIRDAELEVKKHTIFIGPQGSGKSTLAKLIAVFSSPSANLPVSGLLDNYNIGDYVGDNSLAEYSKLSHKSLLSKNKFKTYLIDNNGKEIVDGFPIASNIFKDEPWQKEHLPLLDELTKKYSNLETEIEISLKDTLPILLKLFDSWKKYNFSNEIYIPAERTLIASLSKSIWTLINSDVILPKVITRFAGSFETARSSSKFLNISFLDIRYEYLDGNDTVHHHMGSSSLGQSASGYQSIVPMILVIDSNRRKSSNRFVVEEPELNLYPTAQKDLIYALVGGLQPDVEYHDAEWIITTHSPYVLSSYNTLMLAFKVAQKSDELKNEVEKIIPSRCWINPDDFAAYYVDEGTVRSIIDPKTGLIMDNELDDVSEQLAAEQDQLLELNRSVPRD